MYPVHPSIPKCPNCGAPMNAAAGIANYWQLTPRGVARRDPTAKPKPEKPFPSHRVAWVLLTPPAFFCFAMCGILFLEAMTRSRGNDALFVFFAGVIAAAIGAGSLTPAIWLTRRYRRRLAEFSKQEEGERAGKSGTAPDPAEENASGNLPPAPTPPTMAWFVCAPPAGIFLIVAAMTGLEKPFVTALCCVVALLALVPPIRATRTYNRRWNARQQQVAALLKEKVSSEL